jgi:HTH-type transcriptional repressor of NAD biosynthesis genes
MTRGLVVGKFYPLHAGHLFLLSEASRGSDELWVVMSDSPTESVSASVRAEWIADLYPDAQLRVTPFDIPYDSAGWAERCTQLVDGQIDTVFTSEPYGDEFASLLGAKHVSVDPDRVTAPISGTELRQDLGAMFAYLAPPAKAFFARRICVVGVESSGTTTLAMQLAERYDTVWVPEYGRSYWEGRRYLADAESWTTSEFVTIASAQGVLEDALAMRANRVVIADTDALATHVWHRRYRGIYSDEIWRIAAQRTYDLYVVTSPDFPFVQDGTREGEEIRREMHQWLLDVLDRDDRSYIIVTGDVDSRLEAAAASIDELLRFDVLHESQPMIGNDQSSM